jgi:hypothetical protein
MHTNALHDGWQRFLHRLRRLWGQRRAGGIAFPSALDTAATGCMALSATSRARG